jgi:threonine dehydratase
MDPEEVDRARERLSPYLSPSPLVASRHLSKRFGKKIWLKLESLQDTGSFKIRGALHYLLRLPASQTKAGVVAASAGNHAQGVAWAASLLGISATIFMPVTAPLAKVLATRHYGARVIQEGASYDEAARAARRWTECHGGTLVPAFDHPDVVAGQGTVGLEILEQCPQVEAIIVPVGGGGLISGVALATKARRPGLEIIGVQTVQAPAFARSILRKTPTTVPAGPTLADGIAVASPGEMTFSMVQQWVDRMEMVSEDAIESAIMTFLERKNLVVEGAGAVPLALLLQKEDLDLRARHVVLLLSGGNLDIQWLDRIIQRGALALNRRMRIKLLLPDLPGSLARVTAIIARSGANILQVRHDRLAPDQPVHISRVEFDLEIRDADHRGELLHSLKEEGVHLLDP